MKKFLFTLLVTVALLLGSNTTISAQPSPVAPAAGSGTEADPWQIATLENLYWIAATDDVLPSPNLETRCAKYYIQTADIDASSTATWFPNGSGGYYGWDPIGYWDNALSYQEFTGGYNGQGFKINGLYINRPGETGIGFFSNTCTGLFSGEQAGDIFNTGLTNVNITGEYSVGGLIGFTVSGDITNSYVTGSVTGVINVGGLVGFSDGWCEFLSVFSTANVTGSDQVGGLIGKHLDFSLIRNSYSTGNVISLGDPFEYIGGILGVQYDVINTYFAGRSDGDAMVGGWQQYSYPDNFFDSQMTLPYNDDPFGNRKTTAEMKTKSTYIAEGWDFTPGTGAWQIKETSSGYISYPYLQSIQYDVPGTYPPVNPIPGLEVPYAGGDGTPGNPYQITNWKELSNIRINLSSCFILNNNLDTTGSSGYGATASALSNGGLGWTPIGNATTKFTGNLNGNGHTINGLYINHTIDYWGMDPLTQENIGLFGAIGTGAVISNIGLTNVSIAGKYQVGGLVGLIEGGSVANAYVTGSVTGDEYVGGIAGKIISGTIANAYSTANVNGTDYVGGLLGDVASVTVTNAYSVGTVTGYYKVGGLVGRNSAGTFNNCFWDTQLSGQSSSEGGTGKNVIEMRTQATFTGWDFTSGPGKWQIAAGSGYRYCPCLQSFTYDTPGAVPAVNPVPGLIWAYSGGDGTSGSPFQIANLTDLRYLSTQLFNWSSYFIQTANIVAIETSGWNSGLGFSPLGNVTNKFTGNYNGYYHTITGLYINRPTTDDIGLFGYVGSSGSISKVGLLNVTVTGKQNVGGLVGYFNAASGNITNTYVTGHVSAEGDVGGLVGEIYDGTVTNVYSTANVTGGFGAGGLVGATRDNITNAYSTGLVTGGNTYMGGLIGWEWYTTVTNCFWDKQTSGQNSSASNKGTGKTTSEMKLQTTFTSWDFAAGPGKWQIKASPPSLYKSYPYIQGFTYDEPAASPVVNPIPGLTDLLYSGGIGTPENPYQIATLADLRFLSENSDYWTKHFIQTADIDAAATSGWNSGAGFSPIGNETIKFTGSYNGNGHSIDGLQINRPLQDYIGLFGYINTSNSISNLGLTNITITGKAGVGGLSGVADLGTFTNVYASGNVSGSGNFVGGLVGYMNGSGTLTSTYSTGIVSGTGIYVGGLVGANTTGSIVTSYSTANVSGSAAVGGLAGLNGGTITNSYAKGSVTGTSNKGGLVGYYNGTVTSSFWDTETSGQATSAGGTGKTTLEMKTALTFVGNCWDFQAETGNGTNNYWGINATDNGGYPFLSWQGYTNTATYPSNITIGTTASPTCGWSISGGVLTASTNVTINANDINNALIAGNLTIQASDEIIIDAAIAPTLTQARTLTLKAGGNISMPASTSIAPSTEFALSTIIWSDADATSGGAVVIDYSASINTKGGHLWIGGGSGSEAWNGLTVGNGYAKSTSETAVALNSANVSTLGGDIQIKGESTATTKSSYGIIISNGSMNAGSGNISLNGIGGQATGSAADCDGIVVNGPITTTSGNITLTGSSTAEQWTEGVAIPNSNIISSTSGNISLSTNILWMETTARIGSSGTLTLKPLTDGSTIGIAGGAGTLNLPTAYFTTNFVNGFSGITIGSSTAGNIGIKAIPFNDPVTFNAVGNLNLENDIDLNGQTITLGNEITLNEASGRISGLTGNITTTRNLSNISAVNVAGLGATLTTTANMGNTVITRGHTNQSWGEKNSVLRYYDIVPTNNTGLNATLVFSYNDAELNSLTESKLFLYKSTTGGTTFSCEGGTVSTPANTITLSGIGAFSRWMAAEIMTLTWNGAGSDFNTAANWSPNATPSTFYNLTIPDVATDPIVNQAPATPAVCNDLAIASGAVLTIAPGKSITVNGTLTNSAGNSGLVINSGGLLIHNTNNVAATVKQTITGSANLQAGKYHFTSIPTQYAEPTSSLFLESYLYDLDPTQLNTPNHYGKWVALGTSATTPLFTNKGYMIYYPGDSKEYSFTGNLNNGTYSYSLVGHSGDKVYTFNLLPNPYPSSIVWNIGSAGWNKSAGIGGACYIWNATNGNYSTVASSETAYIPVGQAFMVMVENETSPTLSVNNTARTHSSQVFYKSDGIENQLSITATANGYADETAVRFGEEATEAFDLQIDGLKINGLEDAPQLYTLSGETKYSINNLPLFQDQQVVDMHFVTKFTGQVTLSVTGIDSFGPWLTIFLKDELTGQTINLRDQPVYTFYHNPENGVNRFKLVFGGTIGVDEIAAETNKMWINGNTVYINAPDLNGQEAQVEVFNPAGQRLLAKSLLLDELTTLELNLKGFVIVKLTAGQKVLTTKGILM